MISCRSCGEGGKGGLLARDRMTDPLIVKTDFDGSLKMHSIAR